MKNKKGVCPACYAKLTDYVGYAESKDRKEIGELWTCSQCKKEGIEWYKKIFCGHKLWEPIREEAEK